MEDEAYLTHRSKTAQKHRDRFVLDLQGEIVKKAQEVLNGKLSLTEERKDQDHQK